MKRKEFYVILLLSLTLIGFIAAGATQAHASPVPSSLKSLPLVEKQTGESASRAIAHLHGKTLPVSNAYVAVYAKGEQSVTVWGSDAATEADAIAQIKAMNTRLAESGVFSTSKKLTIEGVTAYQTIGMGMDNIFYRTGKTVVWIAAKHPQPAAVYAEYIKATVK